MAAPSKNETAVFCGIESAEDLGRLWLRIFGAEADAEQLLEMIDLDAYESDTGALSGQPEWETRREHKTLDEWRSISGGADVELARRIPPKDLERYVDCGALGEYILSLGGNVFLTDNAEAVFRLYAFRANPQWIEKIRMLARRG